MEAGQLFGGRYRLVSRLGTGGMSVVWCAQDEVLAREVAVKVLAPKLAADAGLLERIRIEARSAARLRHPNIVDIHDYGEASVNGGPPLPYVVMELVEGRSLANLLTAGPLPWRLAVVVGAQVATALAVAHARRVVHRDVTPGNVMLTSDGVKLVDFGISASAGDAEAGPPGHVLGTPAYLAPERLAGGPVLPATDVYALGLLLYKSLTGRLPWQSATTTQMLKAHLYAEPAPLPAIPGLPAEVVTLCQRCLAKAPEDRPDSAEVARALAAAVDLPVTALALPAELTALVTAGVGRPGPLRRLARAVAGTVALSRQTVVTDGATLRPARQPLAVVSAVVGLLLVSGLMGGSLRGAGAPDGTAASGAQLVGAGFAAREVQCQVRYEVRRDAAGSFATGVTVHNADTATVEGWRLEFSFPADQRVVRPWTGGWRQSGRTVTVEGEALAAGGSVTTGFDGAYRGTNPLPTQFHLNGSACEPTLVWAAPANPAGGSAGGGAEVKPPREPKPPKDAGSSGPGGDDDRGGEGGGDSYRSGGQGNGRG
ncbi:MAG TPA: serine/threonine-protein kinase [Micromonosporaceae bacterium]|nr:serine/threonine-protein kinase [Micromonosporaceae bacterium]